MKKLFSLTKHDRKRALLIDPDFAIDSDWLNEALFQLSDSNFDLILIGGSLVKSADSIDSLILSIKKKSELPVYLFPGNAIQLSRYADGILFISLISGRNPELLIGQQVVSAPLIKSFGLNVLPTGYMLIGDSHTSAHYMSQTQAIPYNKSDIAYATALAGEMLGMKSIYLDGGSGPNRSPSIPILSCLADDLEIPIIVGGGIMNKEQVDTLFKKGANLVVIGTAAEKNPEVLRELSAKVEEHN